MVKPRQEFKIGSFRVELIRTCHSIPDAVSVAVHTRYGIIFHSGDFKFDQTPVDGHSIDYQRIAELGNKGVLAFLSDSTNVERPGYSTSEKSVGENFDKMFRGAKERIVVATFASNVHRIQQVDQRSLHLWPQGGYRRPRAWSMSPAWLRSWAI